MGSIRAPIMAMGVAAGLAACGDPLVEQGYRGVPLHTFRGQITTVEGDGTFEHALRAAVFWSPSGQTEVDDRLVEQATLAVTVRFPSTFEINVFEPPVEVAWDHPDAAFQVGLILLYEDLNDDGHFQLPELRGGARNQALLYLPRALTAATSPTRSPLTAGFHAQRIPLPCTVELEHEGQSGGDCGVPLGASCSQPGDCGPTGICQLRDRYTTWPGGYCVLPGGGCIPQGGVLETTEVNGGPPSAYYHHGCDDDDDCRLHEGYMCENERRCVPGEPASLELRPDFSAVIAATCLPGEEGETEE